MGVEPEPGFLDPIIASFGLRGFPKMVGFPNKELVFPTQK